MNLDLLQQADRVLSKCGRPVITGAVAVPLFRAFVMPMVLQPGQSTVFTKEITGKTTWSLRAISSSVGALGVATGVRIQIQLPNGRFLIGQNGQDVGQFAWIGSWRYNMDTGVRCEPGSKIQVTLTDTIGLNAPFPVNLLFEGAYEFYLKGDAGLSSSQLASGLPRYQGIVNENILAPCWMGGYGPETPAGFRDERFTYSSVVETVPIAGPTNTTLKISIDAGFDFYCRRVLFELTRDASATAGAFVARLRTGSGYALNDNFIDYAQYINGAEYAHDWLIRGEDAVYVDANLVDGAGTTNFYLRVHLEGVRRRRK